MNSDKFTYSYFYNIASVNFTLDLPSISDFTSRCKDGPIIEFGAGTGRLLNHVNNREIHLVENDKHMISHLKERVGSSAAKIIVSNAHNVPVGIIDGDYSGAIFTLNTIAEMQPIIFALSEAARILKNRGLIYLANENPIYLNSFEQGMFNRARKDGMYIEYSINTYGTPAFGENAYETRVEVRTDNYESKFIIPQIFMNAKQWHKLLNELGFYNIELYGDYNKGEYDENKSSLIYIIAERNCDKNIPIKISNNKIFYDNVSTKYDELVISAKYHAVPSWLNNNISRLNNKFYKILDLGCGNGLVGGMLRSNGISGKIYGIDLSDKMINVCRGKGTYDGLLCYDLCYGIPIIESSLFDLITAISMFEFIDNPSSFLKDCYRLLARNGKLWLTSEMTDHNSFPSGKYNMIDGLTKYHYRSEEITSMIEQAGFKIERIEKCCGYYSEKNNKNIPYYLMMMKK